MGEFKEARLPVRKLQNRRTDKLSPADIQMTEVKINDRRKLHRLRQMVSRRVTEAPVQHATLATNANLFAHKTLQITLQYMVSDESTEECRTMLNCIKCIS